MYTIILLYFFTNVQRRRATFLQKNKLQHHKIAFLYFKHLQFIDLVLGHKKNQTFIIYVPAINSVKIICFLEIL